MALVGQFEMDVGAVEGRKGRLPGEKAEAPVEVRGSGILRVIANADEFDLGGKAQATDKLDGGGAAVALTLVGAVDHQAHDVADAGGDLVHSEAKQGDRGMIVAAGGDIVDGQGGEGEIDLSLGEGLDIGGDEPGLCRVELEGETLFVVGVADRENWFSGTFGDAGGVRRGDTH